MQQLHIYYYYSTTTSSFGIEKDHLNIQGLGTNAFVGA